MLRHIESKFSSPMVGLPDGMFDHMSSLTFIHLAAFIPMAKLPSLWGLTNLKSLTLACFLVLQAMPDFTRLGNLERLVLASMPAMDTPCRTSRTLQSSSRSQCPTAARGAATGS
jgi:hypothetical protein